MRCQCIVCTDDLGTHGRDIVSLVCGHTFHEDCLQQWREKAARPNCPSCRHPLRDKDIRKIFLTSLDETIRDSDVLENQLSDARIDLHEAQRRRRSLEDELAEVKETLAKTQSSLATHKSQSSSLKRENERLKSKAQVMKVTLDENDSLKQTIEQLKDTVQRSNHLRDVLKGTNDDVEELLRAYGPGEHSVRQIATYCVLLKRELTSAKSEQRAARNDHCSAVRKLTAAEAELDDKNRLIEKFTSDMNSLRERCRVLTDHLENLPERNGKRKPSGAEDELMDMKRTLEKKLKLDVSVNVPSPLNVRQKNGFVQRANQATKESNNLRAPPGYSKMKIVTGVARPEKPISNKDQDELLLQMMRRRDDDAANKESKIRLGYNGLGGHSNHIQARRR